MNKKIILASLFFIILLIILPFTQALVFTQQTSGKITVEHSIHAPCLTTAEKDLSLVFFGYVGCTKVCTPILYQLDALYDSAEFAPVKPFVGVAFVNLMPEVQQDQVKSFAKAFNPDFKGIYLTQKELMGIDRGFGLFFSKSLSNPTEIDHSDHIYLIKKEKSGIVVLKNIYTTHPLNQEQIIADIKHYVREMP